MCNGVSRNIEFEIYWPLQTPKSKQEKVAAVQPLSEDQKKSAKKPTKLEENEKGPVVGGRRAKSSYR